MAGTKAGAMKIAKRNLEKDPDFYRKLGAKGGAKTGAKGGFYFNRELAKRAGAIGGSKSKRGKANGTSKET